MNLFLIEILLIILILAIWFKYNYRVEHFELGSLEYNQTYNIERGKQYMITIDEGMFKIQLESDMVKVCLNPDDCMNTDTKNLYVKNVIETYARDRKEHHKIVKTNINTRRQEISKMDNQYNKLEKNEDTNIRNTINTKKKMDTEASRQNTNILAQIAKRFNNEVVFISNVNDRTLRKTNDILTRSNRQYDNNILTIQRNTKNIIRFYQITYDDYSTEKLKEVYNTVLPSPNIDINEALTKPDAYYINIKIIVPFPMDKDHITRKDIDNTLSKSKKYMSIRASPTFTDVFSIELCKKSSPDACTPYLFDSNQIELDSDFDKVIIRPL